MCVCVTEGRAAIAFERPRLCITIVWDQFDRGFVLAQLFTNAAAALPCELEDGKAPEQSQGSSNPLQMLIPSKFATNLRTRMARNRRRVASAALQCIACLMECLLQPSFCEADPAIVVQTC